MPTNTVPAIQQLVGSITDQAGVLKPVPYQYFQLENGLLQTLVAATNRAIGVNLFTLAAQPSLGSGDVGYVGFVTDYAHMVYWDGAKWEWLDGDQPGRFGDFLQAPSVGWALCDGSATTLLAVGGATLTTVSVTTPNRAGTPNFLQSGAAYTGTINAAVAPGATMTGSTATGTTASGTTGTFTGPTADTAYNNISGAPSAVTQGTGTSVSPWFSSVIDRTHLDYTITANSLTMPSLTIPGLSIPALGAGTLAATVDATALPSRLVALPYVRR